MNLTYKIKSHARSLGFTQVGITTATPPTYGDFLEIWLQKGYHGAMGWMEKNKEKRKNPQKLLPGAKSVIAVAMNYNTDFNHSDSPGVGKISRYAWGDDYHPVLKERLFQLLEFILRLQPDVHAKVCVDTSLTMDKLWAMSAGIGWMGKHSNVITRDMGSWVFLGEIICSLDLEYDKPIEDYCGTCNACLEACPTSAIIEPYVVDSNRCISYHTIEWKEPIPEEFHQTMNNWIYGCDICQDVCPWNRFAQTTSETVFQPRYENLAPRLEEEIQMTPESFRNRFKKSTVKRTKYTGYLRNVKTVWKGRNEGNPGSA